MDKCCKIIVAEAGNLTPLNSKYINEHDASSIHLPSSQSVPKININVSFSFPKEIVWEGVDCVVLAQEKGMWWAVVKAASIKCGERLD